MAKGRKTGGRQKSTPNKVTKEVRDFARGVLEDPEYQAGVKLMFKAMSPEKVPAHYVTIMYHYAYGQPKRELEITTKRPTTFVLTSEQSEEPPTP